MKIFIALKKFFNFIVKYRQVIFGISIVLFIMLWLQQCNAKREAKAALEAEQLRGKQNLMAKDSIINVYKNKSGEISYEKAIANMSPEELKENFPELYEKMQNEVDPKIIIRPKIIYRDTGSVQSKLATFGNNQYALNFEYKSDDGILFTKGQSSFSAIPKLIDKEKGIMDLNVTPGLTKFTDTRIAFGLTVGVKEGKDGIDRIFVTPDSDKITINDLKGADLTDYLNSKQDPKNKKRCSIGPYIGYGIVFGGQNAIHHGISVGAAFQYSLIRF